MLRLRFHCRLRFSSSSGLRFSSSSGLGFNSRLRIKTRLVSDPQVRSGPQIKSGFVWFRVISVELGNRSWRREVASSGQMTTQRGSKCGGLWTWG